MRGGGPAGDGPQGDTLTVIGTSETGMDAISWLLGRGVNPASMIWVRPNDYWLIERGNIMNRPEIL